MREEQPEQIMCLIDNDKLQKVVAVWQRIGHPHKISDIAQLTGLPEGFIKNNLPILIGNGVVYEDGRVNQYALQFIRSRIIKILKGKK